MTDYIWKKERVRAFETTSKIRISKDEEFLSGVIDGRKASAPEERLARASQKYAGFEFGLAVNGFRGEPGWKELDFLFNSRGTYIAVEVDDTSFIHRGEVLGIDPDDLFRLEGLKKLGVEVPDIIHIDAEKLATKLLAEQTARELFV